MWGIVLSSLYVSTHLILRTIPPSSYYYYPDFTDKETDSSDRRLRNVCMVMQSQREAEGGIQDHVL